MEGTLRAAPYHQDMKGDAAGTIVTHGDDPGIGKLCSSTSSSRGDTQYVRGDFWVWVFCTMNQYYDNVVDRHTVSRQFYNESSVVSRPICSMDPTPQYFRHIRYIFNMTAVSVRKKKKLKTSFSERVVTPEF